jgi:hypothetical protein
LAPFTQEEIDVARPLNAEYRRRVILPTARELEPLLMYQRVQAEFGIPGFAGTPEDLAPPTVEIYFRE